MKYYEYTWTLNNIVTRKGLGSKGLLLVITWLHTNLFTGNTANLSTGFQGSKTGVKDIILSIYSGLWAYDGWSVYRAGVSANENTFKKMIL